MNLGEAEAWQAGEGENDKPIEVTMMIELMDKMNGLMKAQAEVIDDIERRRMCELEQNRLYEMMTGAMWMLSTAVVEAGKTLEEMKTLRRV